MDVLDEMNTADCRYFRETFGGDDRLFFTGWKPEHGDDGGARGVVAQVILRRESYPYFYVNLPGMQSGDYEQGADFDIGNLRIFPGRCSEAHRHALIDSAVSAVVKTSDVH